MMKDNIEDAIDKVLEGKSDKPPTMLYQGIKFRVHNFRPIGPKKFVVTATSRPYFDETRDGWIVDTDAKSGYAFWDPDKGRWEDGEL